METITGKPLDIISFLMAAEDKEAVYDLDEIYSEDEE